MAQLWGGRFTKETDKLVYQFFNYLIFNKSYKFDLSAMDIESY